MGKLHSLVPFLENKAVNMEYLALAALVAACNDKANVSALDEIPEWRDAEPQPLD